MKETAQRIAIAVWITGGTLLSSHFFLGNPQFFPEPLKPLAQWLILDIYDAQNQEEVADLEGWIALTLGFMFTSLVTWLAIKAWRYFRPLKPST